jgi:mannose-1-phosphate guanylyltransferase
MRHAVILAGGSGTRLWPWSRAQRPKQLLPLFGGRSLLQIAFERLDGVVASGQRLVCAGAVHREAIFRDVRGLSDEQFLGEPAGRDTAAALGYCAAVLHRRDPKAVVAVCTADHIIQPVEVFQETLARAFDLAERSEDALVTFGVAPTAASTAYGYLQLGTAIDGAFAVDRYCEKPDGATAEAFCAAGPQKFLWNSGMFVWRASTFLECLARYQPRIYDGVRQIADSYDTPSRDAVLTRVYRDLKKISVDFGVMEPASRDPAAQVLALPLGSDWIDVGSWNAFDRICPHDGYGNAIAAERHAVVDCERVLVASDDPKHLIAVIGCEDLVVVHTANATLVCRADRAESVKSAQALVGERFGSEYV